MVRLSKISVYLRLLNKTFFKLQYFKNLFILKDRLGVNIHINRVKPQKSTKSRLNNHLRSSWWGFRTLIKRRRLFIKWSLRKLILALAKTAQPNAAAKWVFHFQLGRKILFTTTGRKGKRSRNYHWKMERHTKQFLHQKAENHSYKLKDFLISQVTVLMNFEPFN